LEFLPGTEGESIAITLTGDIYYLQVGLIPLSTKQSIQVGDGTDQGLFNIAADPDYQNNHLIYLFFTTPDKLSNEVDRFTINVDLKAETFTLSDRQIIVNFPKNESPAPSDIHNGGGLAFDGDGNLWVAMGDGGNPAGEDKTAAVAQNLDVGLGKVHRLIPNRSPGSGGFTVPLGNNNQSTQWPSIFASGFRNPFTMVKAKGSMLVGDVGSTPPRAFEEIDVVNQGGQDFGWPLAEGFETDPNHPEFVPPLYGYLNDDPAFELQDPQSVSTPLRVIIMWNFYQGSQYNGVLDHRLIYSEFYTGWVRGLKLDEELKIQEDKNLGHLVGMTSLQQGPDGLLYAVSLTDSNQILRLDLVPPKNQNGDCQP
jgi:glucose/arabinose dehydrogenase